MRLAVAVACATGCLSTPSTPPPTCTLRLLDELVTNGDDVESPWLSPDHLSIYVTVPPAQFETAIAYATRATADDRFGPLTIRTDLALPNGDNPDRFWLSPDELEIWIITSNPTYYARRAHASDPFPPPTKVAGCAAMSVTADALTAFYSRGDGPIRITTRASRSQPFDFGGNDDLPSNLDATQNTDSCATDQTGATLYCAISSTTDNANTLRIWQGTSGLPAYSQLAYYTFSELVAITPQPTASDFDPMLAADNRTLLFASMRSPATGDNAEPWIYCE